MILMVTPAAEIAALKVQIDHLKDDLEKAHEKIEASHKQLVSLRQRLMMIGVGVLSILATAFPEVLGVLARIIGVIS